MQRLLVTGASGLLGLNLSLQLMRKYRIIGVCSKTTLTNLPFEIIQRDFLCCSPEALIDETQPDALIHCAAIANIDTCEKNPDAAQRINGLFPGQLAAAAKKSGVRFLHISTDAVFDGVDCGTHGYSENSPTNPINAYAKSKLLGEQCVIAENPDAIIARVNFYGWSVSQTRSLAEFFYRNLAAAKPLKGFSDVFFMPLCVHNLIDILDALLEINKPGLYHVFSSEYQSKYQFGISIAERFGFDASLISPASWKDGGLNAVRSPNLILNTERLQRILGAPLPNQKECLERFHQAFDSGTPQRLAEYAPQE